MARIAPVSSRVVAPYTEIAQCRISGSQSLVPVLSLGEQCLTGIFPKAPDAPVSCGPLDVVLCPESGLLQLRQSYRPEELYGAHYGYRSSLNASMVRHLAQTATRLERRTQLKAGDLVLDIGSNDATLLKAYQSAGLVRIGVDPIGEAFRHYYTEGLELVPDFFTAEGFLQAFGNRQAQVVTSIAMFYDLEHPMDFVRDVERVLADDGLWHFEQSYLPSMLRTHGYDAICHEHLEFYSFRVVEALLAHAGLRVVDVELNEINGGSFAVTACKMQAPYVSNWPVIGALLRREAAMDLDTPAPYVEFAGHVERHRIALRDLLDELVADGKAICGYGASTKGNVLLQYCGITPQHLRCMAEVNQDKWGAFTPGTGIPIVSEAEAKALHPDYFLVLPWHFKAGILERESAYRAAGGKFIFPLPEITIV